MWKDNRLRKTIQGDTLTYILSIISLSGLSEHSKAFVILLHLTFILSLASDVTNCNNGLHQLLSFQFIILLTYCSAEADAFPATHRAARD